MSDWVVGDIQGCLEPLEAILEAIHFTPGRDRVWFCGDLVNRGGKSLEVLRLVRDLGDSAESVLGNHDLHLLAAAEGLGLGDGNNPEFKAIFEAVDGATLLTWLRHRPLTLFDQQRRLLLVHAGLLPQWDLELAQSCGEELQATLRGPDYRDFLATMYGNRPRRWRDDLSRSDRLRVITNALTRLRFCDRKGRMNLDDNGPPGSQASGYLPWFQVPGRRSSDVKVAFGHWSRLGLYRDHNVLALDTGCVWGEPLTAINLDQPDQAVQVPGHIPQKRT